MEHSLNVYNRLLELVKNENLKRTGSNVVDERTLENVTICALLHDVCKVNFYKVAYRNQKNETTKEWKKVPYYTVEDKFPYGHGEKSVFLIERFIRLTVEEAMAIRWHMGGFDEAVKGGFYAFNIEKVQFAFVMFNTSTKKLQSAIDLYLSFDKALLLSNDIISGRIPRLAQAEKAKGEQYPKAVWQSPLGGTSEVEAARRELRSDGRAISRSFTLSPGSSQPYILTAFQQAGQSLDNGLIKPIGKVENAIRVPLDEDTLKALALLIRTHISSYISAQYLPTGNYYKTFERNA